VPGRHQQPPPRLGATLAIIAALAVIAVAILFLRGGDPVPTTTLASASETTSAPITTGQVTTTESAVTTSALEPNTTLVNPLDSLVLAGSGIGEIGLGSDAETTVARLSALLGFPDEDTQWTTTLGTCPGTEARIVRWSSLQIFLTNGETAWSSEPHFFHFGQSLAAGGGEYLDLRTDKEIGIGSSIGELQTAYGDTVTIEDDPAFGPYWEVDRTESSYLWGTATGIDDDSVIDALNGGAGCGE
jgi:hypothetical protein